MRSCSGLSAVLMRLGVWLALAIACPGSLHAQPQIGYAYPAGGCRGTVVRVSVGGQSLRGAEAAYVSGEGVQASVVEHVRALTDQELNDVSRFLRDIVRRRWNAAAVRAAATDTSGKAPLPDHPWLRDLDSRSPGELELLRTRFFDPKKQPNAQIEEQVEIDVSISADAPPGNRELRLLTPAGLTNPVTFQIGSLPEVSEQSLAGPGSPDIPEVDLPVTINGQITPGDVDRFRLRAKKGQRLVIRALARALIPYLADAVPGWFQAVVSLSDPRGRELAYGDDYRFDPDPVLLCRIPEDGLYTLEIRDSIYRGRDDFVYRIAAGELPFITRMYPLGAREGEQATAQLAGWNLPADTVALDTSAAGLTIRRTHLDRDNGLCNEAPYAVGALPEGVEAEPNNSAAQAQAVALPLTINGRIGQPGDVDVFVFEGKAGQELVAEVHARRLNSPVDSMLRLVDPAGRTLASNDDTDDPGAGLVVHQADARLQFTLPEDGAYTVHLADTQVQGGEACAYRLSLGPPQPDFALRLTPSSVNVPAGGSAVIEAHSLRRDGFAGEITLSMSGAPEGFALTSNRIPGDKTRVQMRLSAPRGSGRQVFAIRIEGRARIGDAEVVRPAVPAEDMMQAFIYRHLVPRQEFLVAVTGSRPVPAVWRPLLPGVELTDPDPVRIALGGTAQVMLKAPQVLSDPRRTALGAIRFRLANAPRGITLQQAEANAAGVRLVLRADANMAMVGDESSLIVEALADPPRDPGAPAGVLKREVSLGVLPAISYVIVRPAPVM